MTKKSTNKGKSWKWSYNPYGVIKTGDKWTLLAVECYLRKECNSCVYWRYCKKNNYEGYPIMRQVIRILYIELGKPPQKLIDIANGVEYDLKSGE